jgi:hypothetical protein
MIEIQENFTIYQSTAHMPLDWNLSNPKQCQAIEPLNQASGPRTGRLSTEIEAHHQQVHQVHLLWDFDSELRKT